MPGKVGVKIKAGRNLPVMDRSSDTTDAYVEIKLGNVTQKTDVCRKSLNPQWNTDWFRFELDDAELQDEPLQIRLMDHDTYSANDAIGKVNISLNPLCLQNSNVSSHGKGVVMSGWIPVFDTMHGIRGEVNVIVKVDLFSDANKFRQSSCGVQFFHSPNVPHGYRAQVIHGFVEELVVNDDPEYQWIDKIRTPRASNEARQVVFLKLSGQVQRKIGLKAINLGANAVIGYTQCFDLEGDVGVVARGIGTAVTLVKIQEIPQQPIQDNALIEEPAVEYLRSFERGKRHGSISKFDAESSSNSSNDIVSKILGIDTAEKAATNIVLNKKWQENQNTLKEINENEDVKDMQQLFDQEDQRNEQPKRRFGYRVQNIRNSAKNLYHDKLRKLKMKKMKEDQSENTSMSSSYSDLSRSRTSLQDLKNIFPFNKNKSAINRSTSEGTAMATLIVSSIIRGTSLQSISEHNDGDSQQLDKNEHVKSESLSALPTSKRASTRRKLKQTEASEESISTSSISSSTTEEEGSDACSRPEVPNEIVIVDADTVNMVMKTVLAQDDEEENEWIQPGTTRGPGSESQLDRLSDSNHKLHRIGTKISMRNDEPMVVNLGALQPVDPDAAGWIEPGSTTDEPEVDEKDRRGSILHDLKENISEKIHSLQEHMHLPSFTEGKHKDHTHGLLETAMETMLIEKANILGVEAAAASSDEPVEQPETTDSKSETNVSPLKVNRPSIKKFNLSTFRRKKKANGALVNNSGLVGSAMQTMLLEQVNLAEEFGDLPKCLPQFDSASETESNAAYVASDKDLSQSGESYESRDRPTGYRCAPLAEPESSEIGRITIPAMSLTQIASPTSERGSFYSSEPQLSQNIGEIDRNLDADGLPFISLTNLKLNHEVPESKPLQYHNHAVDIKSETSPIHTPDSIPNPHIKSSDLSVPTAPLPSQSTNYSPSCPQVDLHNHPPAANENNLKNASDTIKSSSYTDLSTNKAPLLAPSPSLNQHRSELASVTASPGGASQTATVVGTVVEAGQTPSDGAPITTQMQPESTSGKIAPAAVQSPAKICNSSVPISSSSAKKDNSEICRRSSDSDLSVTPKGNSICVASERLAAATAVMRVSGPTRTSLNQDSLDMLEYPFLTMIKYPSGFIIHLGATVAARSVKLLERVPNPDEPEVRDSWWKEIRMEVRSHARSLGCNVVLGYTEVTAISEDVCVLSATGTAAVINMSHNSDPMQMEAQSSSKKDLMVSSLEEARNSLRMQERNEMSASLGSGPKGVPSSASVHNYRCFMCHIPYSQSSVPFNVKMKKCAVCKRGKVPDVLLATIEIPECLQTTGRGCFIQAQVVRAKKDLRAESNAKEISDGLPFLEYELHRLLINKLKAKGMNAIFGLKTQIAVGEKLMALIATGTAVYLSALPSPTCPKIVAGNSWTDTAKLNDLQKSLLETFERNREIYQLKCIDPDLQNGRHSDTDDSEDEMPEMDLATGGKDACVLEIDDIEDLEIITLLMEPVPPDGFYVVNTQSIPGLQDLEVVKNLQMFTQVWKAKLTLGHGIGHFPKHFQRILQTIFFKLRTLVPCAICDLRFRLELPESDEIQLLVTGMALGLGEPSRYNRARRKTFSGGNSTTNDNSNASFGSAIANIAAAQKQSDEELIFSLDEDQTMVNDQTAAVNQPPLSSSNFGAHSLRLRKASPTRTTSLNPTFRYSRHLPVRDRYGVDITPLSYVTGGRIEKYLGNLNFFFIRESTSVRENGGISGFVHGFITEILSVVRAHVTALGGNAMVSFYMTELLLVDNQHKNQGQCLVNIGGDAVHVSYFADD
ncbi:unnamed protein product [Hermetia illucens]|uniref:C2 domain-containing protein n=1 Tax=Hermetia illucens TaxID=343691 RepID=A0A7R8V8E0_HERIL|nr:unnamed protein product [Hermetia illucens]